MPIQDASSMSKLGPLGTIFAIVLAGVSLVSGLSKDSKQTDMNTAAIEKLDSTTVKRTEMDDLKISVRRIEDKIDEIQKDLSHTRRIANGR